MRASPAEWLGLLADHIPRCTSGSTFMPMVSPANRNSDLSQTRNLSKTVKRFDTLDEEWTEDHHFMKKVISAWRQHEDRRQNPLVGSERSKRNHR